MNITIFGGSQPKEGSSAYSEAQELGSCWPQRGHIVLTGGYMGTMEPFRAAQLKQAAMSSVSHARI